MAEAAYFRFCVLLAFLNVLKCTVGIMPYFPIVVNTWAFTNATEAAWQVAMMYNKTAVDALVAGCSECESQRCDGTVGWGGDPDENGETTLDALVMDGKTHDAGAVGALRRIKSAIAVARAVMERTTHTLLVGDQATDFAKQMGFKEEDLHSNESMYMYNQWLEKKCQPNYWKNVNPDPRNHCGPYYPTPFTDLESEQNDTEMDIGEDNHDTIGMIVIDQSGHIAGGTSTNGLGHKIPGRVGDSPIVGAGAYVDDEVGGAAATGDGDIMMRFLPSFHAVQMMRTGLDPSMATADAIKRILKYYPDFIGAVVAVNFNGIHGAACHGIAEFPYSIRMPSTFQVQVMTVPCI